MALPWLHPDKLNPSLVSEAEAWVAYMASRFSGFSVTVNEDYAVPGPDSPHVNDSQHFLGNAADLSLHGCSLMDGWLAAERFAFKGIGIYPYWNHPGLHLDVRVAPYRARWYRDRANVYRNVSWVLVSSLSSEVLA